MPSFSSAGYEMMLISFATPPPAPYARMPYCRHDALLPPSAAFTLMMPLIIYAILRRCLFSPR
jgi:hypothetical protein